MCPDHSRLRAPQIRRLQRYSEMLREGPRAAADLASDAGVSEKTLDRDLKRGREEWGWEIEYSAADRKWHAVGGLPIPLLHLTDEERMALLVAEPALRAYGASHYATHLMTALRKVADSLDVRVAETPPPVGFELHSLRETDPTIVTRFARAAVRRERLQIRYRTGETGEEKERQVDPYLIYNFEGGWYAAVYDHLRNSVIDLALSGQRVTAMENTGVTFTIDPAFDQERYRKGGFGIMKSGERARVELLFRGRQVLYQSERVPEEGEERERLPDGALRVSFEAPLNVGLIRWVLQYGSEVEVLAPAWLQEEIYEAARAMAQMYGSDD